MEKSYPEVTQLEPIEMNGPLEVSVKLAIMIPDQATKAMKSASLTFTLEAGIIPTRAKIQEVADAWLADDAGSIPAGTRLMTKPEFIAHITKRETGAAIPMPGNQEFVRSTSEIPRAMLINAIEGVGVNGGYARAIAMTERGLATFTGNQHNEAWNWNWAALDKLDDTELLALYREITA